MRSSKRNPRLRNVKRVTKSRPPPKDIHPPSRTQRRRERSRQTRGHIYFFSISLIIVLVVCCGRYMNMLSLITNLLTRSPEVPSNTSIVPPVIPNTHVDISRKDYIYKAMKDEFSNLKLKWSVDSRVLDRAGYSKKLLGDCSGNGVRVKALKATLQASIDNGYHINAKKITPPFSELKTDSFMDLAASTSFSKKFPDTIVYVLQLDSLESAMLFRGFGTRVAVLNMASAHSAGSSVFGGGAPQEQELCRRSDLVLGIKNAQDNCQAYPLESSSDCMACFKGLYTRDVTVLLDIDFSYLVSHFNVDVITIAAISNGDMKNTVYKEGTRRRVRAMLQAAALNECDVVVLSAFGCGVFNNPPNIVADLFRDVLDNEFRGVFKYVVFGIVRSSSKPETPYIFRDILASSFPTQINHPIAKILSENMLKGRLNLEFGNNKFCNDKKMFFTEQIISLQTLTNPVLPNSDVCFPLVQPGMRANPTWDQVKACALQTHGITLTE